MATKFVKTIGIIFIVLGVVGFFLPLEGIFHLTPVHNIVHLVSWIIAGALIGSVSKSVAFAKVFGFVYLLVGFLGLFTHEFICIKFLAADNVLHFIIALVCLYVGFTAASSSKNTDETIAQ